MLNALLDHDPGADKTAKRSKIDLSSVPYEGKSRSVGFSARISLVRRLEQIRDDLDLKSTNQLIIYALRYFILQYEAGETGIEDFVVKPQVVKSSLDMGDGDE